MSGVKVEKKHKDWTLVSYRGKAQFAATDAEIRELYAKLGEVLGVPEAENARLRAALEEYEVWFQANRANDQWDDAENSIEGVLEDLRAAMRGTDGGPKP